MLIHYISASVARPFDAVVAEMIDRLRSENFEVLSQIDLAATVRGHAGAPIKGYRVLGACHPQLAREALDVRSTLGILLPCHIIVRETDDEFVEITSVDPIAAIDRSGNSALVRIALEVQRCLRRAVEGMESG